MIRAFLKSGNRPTPGSQIYQLMKQHGLAEMDGQNFVGGMKASYQARENQPVQDYLEERGGV